METATWILGALVIGGTSLTIGKIWSGKDKMTEKHCGERQTFCQSLIIQKVDSVAADIKEIKKIINNKLLGL